MSEELIKLVRKYPKQFDEYRRLLDAAAKEGQKFLAARSAKA